MSSDYAVDLQMRTPAGGPALLRGDLLSRLHGPMAEVPAFLIDGNQIAAYDCTSSLGHFELEIAGTRAARICLLLDAESCIDLPIDLPSTPGGGPWA